mgnify:CR=1 FL=1
MDRTNGKADVSLTEVGLRYVQEWQPIETAPKDGSVVVATWKDTWLKTGTRSPHIHIEAMYFDDVGWWYAYDGDGPPRPPTHWMPLPAPPGSRNVPGPQEEIEE